MNVVDGIVELTEKSEIKSLKDFLKTIKEENVNYDKIVEIVTSKFPSAKYETKTMGPAKILLIDADFENVYNELVFTMTLAKRYYTKINVNANEYWYLNSKGNKTTNQIETVVTNCKQLYSSLTTHKYQTIVEFYFKAGFKDSRGGWIGKNTLTNFEITAHQNGQPVILHVAAMKYYTSTGQGNNFSSNGYISRSRYSNYLWFDDIWSGTIFEDGDNSDYLWVLLNSDELPYAFYKINKEDILKACKKTKQIIKALDKLKSKLVKEDFIVDLNDNLTSLKGSIDSFTNDSGEIVKEITFSTTGNISSVEAGIKFITIRQENDQEYMYRFNGAIGKESLSYNRPIETDEDIKNAIDTTMSMIQHSSVLKAYIDDLTEIKNSL